MGMSELITPTSGYYHGYRNGDSVTGGIFYRMNTNARSIAGTYAGDVVPHGSAYTGGNGYDYRMIYVPGNMQVRNNTTYDNAAESARNDRRKNMEWIKSSTGAGRQIRGCPFCAGTLPHSGRYGVVPESCDGKYRTNCNGRNESDAWACGKIRRKYG